MDFIFLRNLLDVIMKPQEFFKNIKNIENKESIFYFIELLFISSAVLFLTHLFIISNGLFNAILSVFIVIGLMYVSIILYFAFFIIITAIFRFTKIIDIKNSKNPGKEKIALLYSATIFIIFFTIGLVFSIFIGEKNLFSRFFTYLSHFWVVYFAIGMYYVYEREIKFVIWLSIALLAWIIKIIIIPV